MVETLKFKPPGVEGQPRPKYISVPKYAVFIISAGIFSEEYLVPLTAEKAKKKALGIVTKQYNEDCKNFPEYKEDHIAFLQECTEAVNQLRSTELNNDDTLVIVEIRS